MKALEHSNVETVIVFRACCPLVVCVLDWAFMGRQLPSARSALSLLLLTAGAPRATSCRTASSACTAPTRTGGSARARSSSRSRDGLRKANRGAAPAVGLPLGAHTHY
eukprot:4947938-Prymnesium_polylepis.2